MKTKHKKRNTVDKNYHPSPIPKRKCKCGCNHEFQPRRKDQVYLNKQHADFAYNNNVRKKKMKEENELNKILRKNDRILKKYFAFSPLQNEVVQYINVLRADGFNPNFNIGGTTIDGERFLLSYKYIFSVYQNKNIFLIKIRKR
ncbi:MAG: hypothetical protein PF481_08350 [Bacteroidales bacterium]|jgi:hypothetical protein|nr:hypothetical protein [Bacteroidales bacterium]